MSTTSNKEAISPPTNSSTNRGSKRPDARESLAAQTAGKAERRTKRARNVGRLARKSRVEELANLFRYTAVKQNPTLDLDHPDTAALAREMAEAVCRRYQRLEQWEEHYTPACYTPRGRRANEVVVHALLQIPQIAYLKQLLAHRPGSGRKATGGGLMQASTFLWMALAQDNANVSKTLLDHEGSPKRAWALGYPEPGSGYKAFLKTMRACLGRHDPLLAKHIMVDLAREACEEMDETGRPAVPGAVRYLAADGFLVKANVQQRAALDETELRLRCRKLRRARFVIYTSTRSHLQSPNELGGDDGPQRPATAQPEESAPAQGTAKSRAKAKVVQTILKTCFGYKVVSLHCVRLNQPVIADVFPANMDERAAVLELLRDLFDLWPDAPVHALIGDGLYDSEAFCQKLVRDWGIQPVFSKGKVHGSYNDWVADSDDQKRIGVNGVPCCAHGLMRFKRKANYWDAEKRSAEGLRRGEPAPDFDKFRIRWQCPVGSCAEQATYPARNARLYTLYPHIGLDDLQTMEDTLHEAELRRWKDACRSAQEFGQPQPAEPGPPSPTQVHGELPAARLLLRASANAVEAAWSAMAGGFQGNHAPLRAAWVQEDEEMDWLLMISLLGLAARRTAFRRNLVARSEQEAVDLGLTEIATREKPAIGPTAQAVARAEANRPVELKVPHTWYGERLPEHTGAV